MAEDLISPDRGGTGRQRPLLRPVIGAVTVLDWSGRVIAAASIAILFAALFANVVLRYAVGTGIAWAYELHALLLPWLVGGGIVIAAARSRNIAITVLPDMCSPAVRRTLWLAVEVLVVVIALSVLVSSQPILKASQYQNLSTLGIKQIWGYASLAYAFAGMAIIALANIVRLLAGEDMTDFASVPSSLS